MSMVMLIASILFGILGVIGLFCSTFIISISSFIFMICFFITYQKEKENDKIRKEIDQQLRLLEDELDGTDDSIEDDIKLSHSYDEAVAELERKLESSLSAEKSKLYKDILNVLQSKQYLAQKRVLLNETLFEKCIDIWPTMFDGIECKVDSDGDGVSDEDENDADHFEVSKWSQ